MKENERYELYAGTVTGTGWPIDGHKLVFSLWEWDNRQSYHLTDWGDEDDEAVMLTMFQAEVEVGDEDADGLEEFSRAWHAGEYDPPGVFCISKDQLTDVEKIDRSIFVKDADGIQEKPAPTCDTCRHHLGGGQCARSLEKKCRDGGFEAWEAKDDAKQEKD